MGFDSVLGGAEEDFDTKMLLDPFEKQLDLPPAAIKLGDGERWQGKIVGEKDQSLACVWVFEADATQRGVEVLARVEAGEHNGLIANQSRASIDRMGIPTLGFEVGFGAGDKEALRLVQPIKPFEVEVSPVHDVESARLGQQQVQNVDVVQFAIADVEKRRDVAPQVQQRVQLDGRLGRAKRSPSKYRQAKIDGAGIQSVDRVLEVDAKRFPGIKTTGGGNERLGKVGIDTPVAALVGIGQGTARNPAVDAHVVQLARLRAQARFDIAQTFPVGQLSERHAEVLVETRKALDLVRSAIARHATAKRRQRQMLRDLRKHQFAQVHRYPLRVSSSQGDKSTASVSNRDQQKS